MNEPIRDTQDGAIPLGYETPNSTGQIVRRQNPMQFILIFCVTVGVLFLGVLLILPMLGKHAQAPRIKCASNLKNIALAIQIYANSHDGRFPATFEELLVTTDLTPNIFVCPESNDDPASGVTAAVQASHLRDGHHLSYVYVGSGLTMSVPNAATVVLAYEPLTNHHGDGINVLFADGHVEWMTANWAKALIAAHPATQPAAKR
jgi:prepilin-type processing-associated H-X9-DG protein